MSEKRKQSSPKKQIQDKGKIRPRKLCPECEKRGVNVYLRKLSCIVKIDGKQRMIKPLSFCLECNYFERNESEIKKIPK